MDLGMERLYKCKGGTAGAGEITASAKLGAGLLLFLIGEKSPGAKEGKSFGEFRRHFAYSLQKGITPSYGINRP